MSREMRILCRCADGTPHTCKPLKLRLFASAGSCWPREKLSPYDNALRYADDQGLDFQGLRLSRAADSRKRSVSIKGRFGPGGDGVVARTVDADGGQVTLGAISGIPAAAVASMPKGMMAGLMRREGES